MCNEREVDKTSIGYNNICIECREYTFQKEEEERKREEEEWDNKTVEEKLDYLKERIDGD